MISRIGKYTVEAELGRGGFGQVYKAWDPDVRQSVAIKVLLAEGDSDLLKRFKLEVVTTASLHHKNIVTIYASGEEEGTPYLVMELLEGQTLSQIVKERTPLSLLDKVRIMTQVAEGLAYAHSKGVVHRDVKPANIMLLRDGSVKIMDFGIALASNRRTVSMTMDGFVLGTVPYMAPEQFTSDAKANEQTDIFAFGDVYYELLTGHHPFEPFLRDLNALRVAVLTHDPPAVSRLAPDCPEALELLVHRCIAKERDFRYQKFEELRLDSSSVLVDLQHEQAAAILREVPELMITGGLQDARAKVREAQRLEPGNREARQLLETIDQKLQETINRERISARLAEADKHLSERRFAEAVQALETAAKVDRADTSVRKRLADAKAKLDGAVQANRLVEEARSKQAHGELEDALERLDRAIRADPEHTEARRLFPKISEQLARRERDQIRQKALRTVSEHLARKQFPDASAALDELEKQDSGVTGIADLRHEIERQKAEEERRVRAERFNLALARTRETMQAGDLERAGQMLVHLTANFASEAGAAGPVALLGEQLNALLRARDIADCRQRANDLMNRRSYREASALLAETLNRYPAESGLVKQKASADALEEARRRAEAVAAVLERANRLRGTGDLRGALAAIAAGRGRLGEETALADLAGQLEIEVERQRYAEGLEHLIESVRALMATGKHEEAVDRITQAKDYSGEAEVVALLVTARSTLALKQEQKSAAQALADASSLGTQRDWSGAIRILEDARSRYPHNTDLLQALDRFRGEMEREQRRDSIERHRTAILREIEAGLWEQADKTLRRARAEFPDEGAFLELAERIEGGLRERAIQEAISRVRAKLTADSLPEAMRQLEETQAVFAGDRRWQDLQQEIARWREYEAGLEEARRLLSQGNPTQAEALLTGLVTNAPDLRASQMIGAIQNQRAGRAAAAQLVRQSLERNDTAQATADLNTAQAKFPGERLWTDLQAEIAARHDWLREQAAMAEAVREFLRRDDIRQAAGKLAEARVKYPNHALWTGVEAEIDAREAFLKRQAEIAALADSVRECLRRGDLKEASARLRTAQGNYPKESLWATLRREIDSSQADLDRQARVREIAESVRGHLRQEELAQAASELMAARRKFPDEILWNTLQQEIEERQRVAAAAASVRRRLQQGEIRQAHSELSAARARYPSEGIWATLQAEIDACREAQERRAQIAAAAASIRAHLERGDLSTASLYLEKARAAYPGQGAWATLQAEIEALHAEAEAARERQRRSDAIGAIVEHVQALLGAERIDDAIATLRAATTQFPGEARLANLLRACESQLLQREVQEIRSRAEALLAQGNPQAAADLIEPRHAAEPLVAEVRARVHRELDRQRCRAQLLSVEQQVQPGLGKRRWRELDRAAQSAAASYAADAEIATIAARIHARVEAMAAPSRDKPFLWKLIAAGVAGVAAVAAALLLAPSLRHKAAPAPTTFQVDIRTDPPGATVRLGALSCVTPSCRLDLAPGSYELTAALDGYAPHRQMVVVNASTRPVELTLEPLPPVPTSQPTAATGTLVVQTGVAGALVYVDGAPRSRTDKSGSLALSLEARTHDVRVERNGYEKAAPRQVAIAPGSRQTVMFRLTLQPSKLEVDGAPAGVEIRIAGNPVGHTDGSAVFVFPTSISPGDQELQITQGAAKRAVRQLFEPGQTAHLEWTSIAPAAPPPPPPTPEEVERQDWERLGTTPGAAQLQDFLRKHPGGAHAGQARSRIADMSWDAVDKTSLEALHRFLRDNPDNSHRPDAQKIVDQLEATARQQQVKAEQGKQEQARQELPKPDPVRNTGQDQLERQRILDALGRLDSALQHNRPRDVKAIWPGVTPMFLESLATPRTRMALTPPKALDIRFAPQVGQATVNCVLVVTSGGLIKGHTASVTLRNHGAGWVVEALNVD